LTYGVEGFATPKHLVKEDGAQAKLDERLQFKVIEFNKEARRIILSHSRIFEDEQKVIKKDAENKAKIAKKEAVHIPSVEKTTLGDIEELVALKEKMEGENE